MSEIKTKYYEWLAKKGWKPSSAHHKYFDIFIKGKIIFFTPKVFGLEPYITLETIKRICYIENITVKYLTKKLGVANG